jgi:hypothetical protein
MHVKMWPCDLTFLQDCSKPINRLQMMHQFAPGNNWEKFTEAVSKWFKRQIDSNKFSLDQVVAVATNSTDFTKEATRRDGNLKKVRTISTNGDTLTTYAVCVDPPSYPGP